METYIRSGTYTPRPELPYTPGTDAAGDVEAVGEGVRELKAGRPGLISGTLTGAYAEKVLCERSRSTGCPKESLSAKGRPWVFLTAPPIAPCFSGQAPPADIVLVHGADGGVGVAAMQFARARGMTIIATVGWEEGRALADGRVPATSSTISTMNICDRYSPYGRSRRRRDPRDARQREPREATSPCWPRADGW